MNTYNGDYLTGEFDFKSLKYIQVLFPGGVTRAVFDVRMVDDMIVEDDETFEVSINPDSLPYGVTLGTITKATVVI